ncbi:beta-ketoacyl-[acyl-carrier-protein] synthase family protein [Pseudovibrio sp. WM33]|uniref:beta-ketoacyl-[acyl-carrier-protein] synthase family protein n=1 Tax=Pseudovibrio sp. WM33 TaxID=1735585 RepID=UPI0007AE8F0E|nr:beta-ketoacyl-[acyl-carrier-protein] synthase family protein [Pseudovibrio sp. WM33]KZL24689.1 3-oxoacyl-[acyl-carrier-protein] synthase 2 [Pseudovibrio sp. WM33]
MAKQDDIVISAFGCVTPIGSSYEEIKSALRGGHSGIREIKKYDTGSFKSKHAFIPKLGNEKIRWPHRGKPVIGDSLYTRTALSALKSHPGYALEQYDPARIGCYLGVDEPVADIVQTINCVVEGEPDATSLDERAAVMERHFRVSDFLNYSPITALKQVRETIEFSGPAFCHLGLCSASLQAIGSGFHALQDNRLDAVVVGGVTAKISPEHLIALEAADVIVTDGTVPPEERSRPFDQRRSGYVPAEGAVFFVLERKSAVEQRGAKPLLKILGYGSSLNAQHIVKPHIDSLDMVLSMRRAIKDSGITPDQINLVNAHGTSTQLNDLHESKAINDVFDHRVPVTANKSLHGHMIAAAGAMETLNTLISSQEGFVPGTINLKSQDPRCDVDVVSESREMAAQTVLKNSFGMGGLAATVILQSYAA